MWNPWTDPKVRILFRKLLVFETPNDSASNFLKALVHDLKTPILPLTNGAERNINDLLTFFLGFIHPFEQFGVFLLKEREQISLRWTEGTNHVVIRRNGTSLIEAPKTVEEQNALVPGIMVVMNFLIHISVELFDDPMFQRLRNTDLAATRFGMVHVDDAAHSPMMAHINHSRHIYNARNI